MMRLPKVDYQSPLTLADACALIGERQEQSKLLAGGTDLLVACKLRNSEPSVLISLAGIPELQGMHFDQKQGLRIGAMTSLNTLRCDTVVSSLYPALAEAAAAVGTRQLQHMGTVGGNLCLNTRCFYYNQSASWRQSRAVCLKMGGEVCHVVTKGKQCYAVFSGDLAPALIACKAQVTLVNAAGTRTVSLSDLYSGDGKDPLRIKPDEILQEVLVPPPTDRESSTYLKYRLRGAIDFPLAGVAVRLTATPDGLCENCVIVVNAVASAPQPAASAASLLMGKPLTAELINQGAEEAIRAAQPVKNVFGSSPSYRRKMIGILTRQALTALAQKLRP